MDLDDDIDTAVSAPYRVSSGGRDVLFSRPCNPSENQGLKEGWAIKDLRTMTSG